MLVVQMNFIRIYYICGFGLIEMLFSLLVFKYVIQKIVIVFYINVLIVVVVDV